METSADTKKEVKYYTPDPSYRQNSWIDDYGRVYSVFEKYPEAFWEKIAEKFHWFSGWERVREWNFPHAKWFVNGKTNITYNCLDRHLLGERRNGSSRTGSSTARSVCKRAQKAWCSQG
jgi:acetyl-CoA synthetase